MKTLKKQIVQRMWALVLTICMVLGLMPTELVKAEEASTATGQFVVATNFDIDEKTHEVKWIAEGEDPIQTPEASWSDGMNFDLGTSRMYFAIETGETVTNVSAGALKSASVEYSKTLKDFENPTETDTYTKLSENERNAYLSIEQATDTYWDEDEEKDVTVEYEDMTCIRFFQEGSYKLTYNESSVYINVTIPQFGFYKDQTASNANFIDGCYEYSSEEKKVTIYAVTNFEDGFNGTEYSLTCTDGNNEPNADITIQEVQKGKIYSLSFQPGEMESEEWINLTLSYKVNGVEDSQYVGVSLVKKNRGLVVIYPDYDEETDKISYPDQPDYTKVVEDQVSGGKFTFYLGYVDDSDNLTQITTLAGITADNGLSIAPATNAEEQSRTDGLFDITPTTAGKHTITYTNGETTSSVTINVVENRIKIYADEACEKELERDEWGTYLWDSDHSEDTIKVYVKITPNDSEKIEGTECESLEGNKSRLDIVSSERSYTITRPEGVIEEEVCIKVSGSKGAEDKFDQEIRLYINFGEDPVFQGIYIDENGNLNGNKNDNNKYFRIVKTGEKLTYKRVKSADGGSAPEDYDFHYNSANHTLTLNNMNISIREGSVISSDFGNTDKLTINLIGENTLQTASGEAIWLNGNTTVTTANGGKLTVTGGEKKEGDCPAAISIGEKCELFSNYADITTKVASEGAIGFSAWGLAYGNNTIKKDDGSQETVAGRIINFGTITGRIGLFDGVCENLVSCNTSYDKPTDHPYIGKAYYFTEDALYPNNMLGTLNNGDWRVVGEYNEDGTPRPSNVWYQWIYKDAVGTVYTEDRKDSVQFLVYPEDSKTGKSEDLLTPDDVASVDDGDTHTFNTDLYAVWLTNGNVTVDGDVILDVACSSAPVEEWLPAEEVTELVSKWTKPEYADKVGSYHEDGATCYVKDDDGVQFQDSSKSSITITGNAGYLSLSDTYQGDVTVNGNINFCALYKEKEFLKDWIYRLQWQFDGSPYYAKDVPYCAVPNGGLVVDNGEFTQKVEDLAFAPDVDLKGAGLYDGTYFVQTEQTKGEGDSTEKVAGTSAVVNDNSLLVNVSKKNGLDKDTYPLVRQADASAEQKIKSHLANSANMVAMDIAVIKQTKNEKDEVTAQVEVEPTGKVNLYFDRLDLSGLKNPALFHIKDNGLVEKIAITTGGGINDPKSVKCETSSFSTYVFAEDQAIINPTPSNPPSGDSGSSLGGGGSAGGSTTTPAGDKKDTDKTDAVTEEKTVTKNEDGTSTEKTVIEGITGATTVTVTANKNADGEVTSAKATVTTTANTSGKSTISAEAVEAIQKAAETKDVELTFSAKDADGNLKYKVKLAAEDLTAGNKLYIYKLDTKTGKYTMVNAKTYLVSEEGSVDISLKKKATYVLFDSADAKVVEKQILATVKPAKKTASVKTGKKTTFKLSSAFDQENVKSVTYTTAKKSVATISKSGKITAKSAGTVVVKAKVTLKNGKTKTIKMTIKVK